MDRILSTTPDQTEALTIENAELRARIFELEAQISSLQEASNSKHANGFVGDMSDHTEAMITYYDMDGSITHASGSRTHLTGYSLEDLLGRSAFDFMHPEDVNRVRTELHPKLMRGENVHFEWRSKLKNGGYRWLESSTRLLFDDAGTPIQIQCMSIDIQRRKEIEFSFQRSEARWRAMVEGSPDYIRVVDRHLRLIYANRVMPGQSWDPHAPLDYRAWIPENSREPVAKAVAEALATQTTIVLDDLKYVHEGEEYWLRLRFSPILRDGEDHVLIIVSDITALKQGQAAVRESEAKYRLLFERSPEPAWVLDMETWQFLAVNPAAVEHYGYSEREFLTMTGLDIRPQEDIESYKRNMRRMRGRKDGRSRYVRHIRKDGSILYADALWHEIEFQGRSAYLVFSRDVTDEKEAEDAIQAINAELDRRVNERTAQLQAINHELESFTYSVSHDLRSPLRSIDGYSTMLLNEYGYLLDGEAKEYLERIRISGRRMSDLINNLLGLSRLTRTPLKPEKLSLTYLAQSIIEELRTSEPGRQGDVYVHPEMWIVADPQLMQIALTNLIENAIKFTSKRSHPMIEVGVDDGEAGRQFYVKDNGAGFDMTYADKLFGPFQRLHSDREFEGTGIGLATVQRILQRHGGRIWADAAVDKGATFWFWLPEDFSAI